MKKNVLARCFPRLLITIGSAVLLLSSSFAQSYYDMSSGDYSNSFTGWTNYAVNWNGLTTNATGAIPSATRITAASTNIIAPGSGAGVQSTSTSTNLQFLSTGATANTSSVGADLNLNFSGRNAGTINFAAAQVANSTGNRVGTLQLYYTTDGTTWSEVTGTGLPFTATNNVASSANISVNLPSALNGQSTVKLRFYYYNGPSAGTTGSRPKISIDDLLVTSSASVGSPSITSFTPTGGPAGTAVTITGTNFTGATAVTFNGVAATIFTVNSPTQITATVPADATTGAIAIVTPLGSAASADSFIVPSATVTLPAQILEGATGTGTVTLTSAPASDVVVSLASSSPTDLVVPASVTVAAGFTTADFEIQAPLDGTIDADVVVTVTPTATGFVGIPANITVKNIDVSTVALTSGGYTQTFTGFSSAATLPLGWSLNASVQTYTAWETTDTGAKFSSATVDVFGYQHTGSTGVVQQVLTLRNETGAEINNLTISYNGRMAISANGRTPSYTVSVDGQTVTALAYSTADGDNVARSVSLSGLTVAPNQVFQIIWSSDGSTAGSPGSGSRRQIGISSVSVSPTAALLPPSVSGLTIPLGQINQTFADGVSANVTSDGGSAITERGFVYAPTSVNSNPIIGGTGVINRPDPLAEVGQMVATLSPLTAATSYSVKAYAVNAQGTTYTAVQTFSTLAPPASFTGNYEYPFDNFTGVSGLPGEWTAISSTGVQTYVGLWNSASSTGGFYGGVSAPGVLGYTHTSSTGTLTVTLRLVNNTGSTLTQLNVGYLGRVERVAETRTPEWTVTVAGVAAPDLTYSTSAGVDETKAATVTGLNVAPGDGFTIIWSCDRGTGTGSSRRIGLADVVVSTGSIATPTVNVTGSAFSAFSTTAGTPSAAQTVSVSGSNLTGNITITPPAGYEVSSDGIAFSSSVSLTPVSGSVASTTISVRLSGAAAGSFSGDVSFASTGATTQTRAVSGTVASAYDAWAASYSLTGASALPTADPDSDGLNNNSEYAFGTNPIVSTATLLSTTTSGGNMTVTWIERNSGLTYAVQSTTNLATTAFANDGSVTPTTSGNQAGVPTGYTRKEFTVPASNNKFFRVRATP